MKVSETDSSSPTQVIYNCSTTTFSWNDDHKVPSQVKFLPTSTQWHDKNKQLGTE